MKKQKSSSFVELVFSITETVLVILALCILMGVVLDRSRVGVVAEDFGSVSPLAQVMNYSAYILGILLGLSQYKRILKFAFKDIFLWIFIATTVLSSIWSENPILTIGRSTALFGVTILGTYLASRYSLTRLFQILCLSLGIVAISSLFFTWFSPSEAIVNDFGRSSWRWQGVLAHPTHFGRIMALSTVSWLLCLLSVQQYRIFSCGMILLSVILTFLSHAVSGYISILFVVALMTVLLTSRGRYRNLVLITWAVIIPSIVLGLLINHNLVLTSFNRDITLTGRIPLWIGVFEMIFQQPWFGYGYGAFWTGNGPSTIVWLIAGWKAAHAHNAILDIWLQVGLIGLISFLLSLFRNIFKAIVELNRFNKLESLLPITFLVCLITINLVDSGLTAGNILWALYVFLSTYLSKQTITTVTARQRQIKKV